VEGGVLGCPDKAPLYLGLLFASGFAHSSGGGGGARGWSGWGCMCLQGRCPVWALLCGSGLLGLCDVECSTSAYPLHFVRRVLGGERGPPSALGGTSTIVKTRFGGRGCGLVVLLSLPYDMLGGQG
jgi:hypothetical protein